MKTLFKKLNLGVLLTGLAILTSCGSDNTFTLATNANVIYRTIPSLAVKVTKCTENKNSKYFINSAALKNRKELSGIQAEKTGRTRKAMPISIGNAGSARLVSSKPLNK